MSLIRSRPSRPTSSSLPTKGEMKAAPALAAKQRLGGAEAERDVDLHAVGRKPLRRLQPVPGQGHLDRDVGGDRHEPCRLGEHAVHSGGGDLRTHRARDERAHLLDHLDEVATALLDQRSGWWSPRRPGRSRRGRGSRPRPPYRQKTSCSSPKDNAAPKERARVTSERRPNGRARHEFSTAAKRLACLAGDCPWAASSLNCA
jgi:hypothetical protein